MSALAVIREIANEICCWITVELTFILDEIIRNIFVTSNGDDGIVLLTNGPPYVYENKTKNTNQRKNDKHISK
jgi:hypothetical protein